MPWTGRGNSYRLSPDEPWWEWTLLQGTHGDKLSLLSTVTAKHSQFLSFDAMATSMSHILEEEKKGKGWRPREQWYCTLYFEDYISQHRCVKE